MKTMKVKDCAGEEIDIYDACVEVDRDGRKEVYFYVMGRIRGDYYRVRTCCIKAFRGVEGMDAALDLLQELRAGLREERETSKEKAREAQP